MIFNSWTFATFLAAFFLIYWTLKPTYRLYAFLIASLSFYTYYFPAYTLLIGALSIFVYFNAYFIRKYRANKESITWKKPVVVMWISITICVLVLGYYKYLKLLLSTLNDINKNIGMEKSFAIPEILVPLGLSFFIFEFIHYLVDSYHGRTQQESILEFGVFAMFFPTLVSGPIKRFQPFLNQLRDLPSFKHQFLTEGLARILRGLAKKVLIADMANIYAAPLLGYASNPNVNSVTLWLAVYAYAIRIYFDFSGYTDIAIGCAKLFGFQVPENFNKPYLKSNISKFWSSWHMSLSSWLREYIYMPVGKKLMPSIGRKAPLLLAGICQTITMGICGLWHGASWNFLVWGLYHGVGLTIHKGFSDTMVKFKKRKVSEKNTSSTLNIAPVKNAVATLFTFHFVCIGWVLFVLDIKSSIEVIGKLLFIM